MTLRFALRVLAYVLLVLLCVAVGLVVLGVLAVWLGPGLAALLVGSWVFWSALCWWLQGATGRR
jgi:hypothetical protein